MAFAVITNTYMQDTIIFSSAKIKPVVAELICMASRF